MEVRMETNRPLNISNRNLSKERIYGNHEKKKKTQQGQSLKI